MPFSLTTFSVVIITTVIGKLFASKNRVIINFVDYFQAKFRQASHFMLKVSSAISKRNCHFSANS